MNAAEQGVRPEQGRQGRHLPPLGLLLLLSLLLFMLTSASTARADEDDPRDSSLTAPPLLRIAYDSSNSLQKQLAMALLHQLSRDAALQQHALRLHLVDTAGSHAPETAHDSSLLLIIGKDRLKLRQTRQPGERHLYLLTSPVGLDETLADLGDEDAVLYMTQPWCRQLRFIRLLNPSWKSVGLLSSHKQQAWHSRIHDCARQQQLNMLIFDDIEEEKLSASIRSALRQSDLLLAVPDGRIYNRRTVRNILLSSYRLRKPLIAYSRNFVDAGALAAIHSNIEAIAVTATGIIRNYFDHGRHFDSDEYYPSDFEVSINPQVFKALDIDLPDPEAIRQTLLREDQAAQAEKETR